MADTVKDTVKTRKVAILAADGVDEAAVAVSCAPLTAAGAVPKIVAPRGGTLKGAGGGGVTVDWSLLTVGSVLFDAVFVPGGAKSTEALGADGAAVLFVREAYKHCKAVGGGGTGLAMLRAAGIEDADLRGAGLPESDGPAPRLGPREAGAADPGVRRERPTGPAPGRRPPITRRRLQG